jgi:hypothetical protein
MLLKMQVSLLEEKLQVVTQELQVYRGIDVYHATRQSELLTTSKMTQAQHLKVTEAFIGEAEKKKGEGEGPSREAAEQNKDDDEEDDDDFFGGRKLFRPSSSTFPSSSSHRSFNNMTGMNHTLSPFRPSSRLSLAEITSAPHSNSTSTGRTNPALASSSMASARTTFQHATDTKEDYFFSNGTELRSKLPVPTSPSYARLDSPSKNNYYQRSHLSSSRSSYAIVDSSNGLANSTKAKIGSPHRSTGDDLLARAEIMRERQMRRLERERALRAQILSEEKSQRHASSLGFSTLSSSAFKSPMPSVQQPLSQSVTGFGGVGTNSASPASAARSVNLLAT